MPPEPGANLAALLHRQAGQTPEALAYTFLDRGREVGRLTFAQLQGRVVALAASLVGRVRPGDRVAVLCEPGLDFVVALWTCLHLGAAAVPLMPPTDLPMGRRAARRLVDSQVGLVLTTGRLRNRLQPLVEQTPELAGLTWALVGDVDPLDPGRATDPYPVEGAALAVLQYTSGSTGEPKGVMVTHANLSANIRAIVQVAEVTDQSILASWLPPYHDMGLVGVLLPVCAGGGWLGMAPGDFIADPAVFLEAITRYAATTVTMPNFGYALATSKTSAARRSALDLSSWRIALNGAEPVRGDTMDEFAQTFAAVGFDRAALMPTYGLAEATLAVTMTQRGRATRMTVDAERLERDRVVVPVTEPTGRVLVSCGPAVPSAGVRIVDPQTGQPCAEGQVGEIWVSGPAVTAGYWGRDDDASFRQRIAGEAGATCLRTGDLGAWSGGGLYVTGRLKDVIVIRGRNLHPQDIERAVERVGSGIRPGCVGAVSVDDGHGEGLLVVAEIRPEVPAAEQPELVAKVRRAVLAETAVHPTAVVLVPPRTLPKTTSGKLRRHVLAQAWTGGELGALGDGRGNLRSAVPGDLSRHETTALEQHTEFLLDQLRRVSGLAELDPATRLTSIGLDSIQSVQLQRAVEDRFGVQLEPAALLGDLTVAEMAALAEQAPARATAISIDATEQVAAMSDEDVAALLAEIEPDSHR